MEYKRDLATPLAPTLGGPGDRRKKRNTKRQKIKMGANCKEKRTLTR